MLKEPHIFIYHIEGDLHYENEPYVMNVFIVTTYSIQKTSPPFGPNRSVSSSMASSTLIRSLMSTITHKERNKSRYQNLQSKQMPMRVYMFSFLIDGNHQSHGQTQKLCDRNGKIGTGLTKSLGMGAINILTHRHLLPRIW